MAQKASSTAPPRADTGDRPVSGLAQGSLPGPFAFPSLPDSGLLNDLSALTVAGAAEA